MNDDRCRTARGPHRRFRRAVAAVAFLVASAVAAYIPPPTTRPRTGPCVFVSTPDQVFLGLYSIYYRADRVAEAGRVKWPPAPLKAAAKYLRCDPDPVRRPPRIRRAAIKLAAGIVLLGREDAKTRLEFEKALDELGVPRQLAITLAEVSGPGILTFEQLEDTAGRIIDTHLELGLENLRHLHCACIESCQIFQSGDISVAQFKLFVNRASQCFFHAIDPQCWPGVSPLNFPKTFVLNMSSCPSGVSVPACRSNNKCDTLATPSPQMMPSAPGAPWCGLLYEDFRASASGFTSEIENVLKVMTQTPDANTYWMDYGLCESRDWSICSTGKTTSTTSTTVAMFPVTTTTVPACSVGKCAIDVDCGYARVTPTSATATDTAYLAGAKRLRFTSAFPSSIGQWAQIALEVLVTETAIDVCTPATVCPGATGCPTSTTIAGQGSTSAPDEYTCPDGDSCSFPDSAKLTEVKFCD